MILKANSESSASLSSLSDGKLKQMVGNKEKKQKQNKIQVTIKENHEIRMMSYNLGGGQRGGGDKRKMSTSGDIVSSVRWRQAAEFNLVCVCVCQRKRDRQRDTERN